MIRLHAERVTVLGSRSTVVGSVLKYERTAYQPKSERRDPQATSQKIDADANEILPKNGRMKKPTRLLRQ